LTWLFYQYSHNLSTQKVGFPPSFVPEEQLEFFLDVGVFQPDQVKLPNNILPLNGKLRQIRFTVRQHLIYKGDSRPTAYHFQNQLKAGNADISVGMDKGFIIAQQLLLQDGPGAGAFFPVDDGFIHQLGNGNFLSGESVSFLTDANKGFLPQASACVLPFVKIAFYNGKIQLVFVQQPQKMLRIFHNQRQRIVFPGKKPPHLLVDDIVADGLGSADFDFLDFPVFQPMAYIFIVVAYRPGVLLQNQGSRCFLQASVFIGKELAAILPFQKLDVLGNRWLGNVQLLRRLVVTQCLTKGKKRSHSVI